ncbi:MAG: hypothetical protein CVV28_02360 [Methanobacteriales archaeon HGW-Methanobacteriales-1]|jgi:hypothetical protein|nr:MAG: hypothetical protein CVV28_02360 [Methanobacteriales archaeon HGW-Methanobacteriales-1]
MRDDCKGLPIVKFNKHYSKLANNEFSTIRLKGYEIGKEYRIKTPQMEVNAICSNSMIRVLGHIPDVVLMHDTDTESSEDALNVLKKFYPHLKEDSTVYLISFEKSEDPKTTLFMTFYITENCSLAAEEINDYFQEYIEKKYPNSNVIAVDFKCKNIRDWLLVFTVDGLKVELFLKAMLKELGVI